MRSHLSAFKFYLTNRRRQLQDWEAAPPVMLGIALFTLGVFSLGTSLQILRHPQAPLLLIGIPIYEFVLALSAALFAKIYKMRGRFRTVVIFLNIGIWPLMLTAPLTKCAMAFPQLQLIWMGLGVFIFLSIFGNWRESLEVAFEFSQLQGTIVLALAGGILMALGIPFFH